MADGVDEIWRYQGGDSGSFGHISGVTAATDNSIYLAGEQYGINEYIHDFAVVKLDADGDLLWDWQEGSENDDALNYFVAVVDGVVVSGWFSGTWDGVPSSGGGDFASVKLYSNGTVSWRWQEGTEEDDHLLTIVETADGNVVVAGGTEGSWNDALDGWYDIAAAKLNVNDGEVIWKYQAGTTDYSGAQALASAARGDGSVVLGGKTHGSFATTFEGDSDTSDFLALALDEDGNELWRWQDGPGTGRNYVWGVAAFDDGSVLLAGYTEGNWFGINSGGQDFAITKLNASGTMEWKWQSGTEFDEKFQGAAIGIDGFAVISGYTYGSWAATQKSDEYDMDFVAISMDSDGNIKWTYQAGTTSDESFNEVAVRPDGSIVLAGSTTGTWKAPDENGGFQDFAALLLRINTSTTSTTPSPIPPSTPFPTPSPTTPSPTTPSSTTPSLTTPSPTPSPTLYPSTSGTAPSVQGIVPSGPPSSVDHPDVESTPSPESSSEGPAHFIIGGLVGGLGVITILIACWFCWWRRRSPLSSRRAIDAPVGARETSNATIAHVLPGIPPPPYSEPPPPYSK